MTDIGYTTAADIEPYIMRFLRAHIRDVTFKCEPPTEQTTTAPTPFCYVYTQARQSGSRVTDRATVGLAYYQGAGETTTQAFTRMADIIGLLSSEAPCIAEGSPLVKPDLDGGMTEFTLAEQPTASHAKPVYYAAVEFLTYRNVKTVTV